MTDVYYAIVFNGKTLGFSPDMEAAQRLADVFGPGSTVETIEGAFPADEYRAAYELEKSRARNGLRLVG